MDIAINRDCAVAGRFNPLRVNSAAADFEAHPDHLKRREAVEAEWDAHFIAVKPMATGVFTLCIRFALRVQDAIFKHHRLLIMNAAPC